MARLILCVIYLRREKRGTASKRSKKGNKSETKTGRLNRELRNFAGVAGWERVDSFWLFSPGLTF